MFDSSSFKKSSFVCDFDGDQTRGLTLTQFCTHIFRRLLMGNILLTVSKWRPLSIFKEQYILNGLFKPITPYDNWSKTTQVQYSYSRP